MQKVNTDQSVKLEIPKNLMPLYRIMQPMDGKNVLILGYGREGQATLSMLQKLVPGAKLTVADIRPQQLPEGVQGVFGDGYQNGLAGYDVVIKSPGIVLTDKSDAVLERVTSQTELFLRAYRKQVIGITGTKGKSTTTALTWHVLKSVRPDTLLMGNIGIPAFLQAESIGPETLIVYELSCHQLEYISVSPHVAVLLNLFEEHLDHYGTKEAYFNAKRNICRYQDADDIYFCNILQKDDVPEAKARRITMQQAPDAVADLSVIGREVHFDGNILPLPVGCTRLAGEHNLYNIGTAYGICRQFGVTDDQFMEALADFDPLPHRLQRVGTFDGVTYYDDSISTACETAIGAMKALAAEGVGSILLGGMDRGIDYTSLVDFLMQAPQDNPQFLILMPDSGMRVGEMLLEKGFDRSRLIFTDGLEQAVQKAKEVTPKGKVCLLSPAAASYGFFKNFEERGEFFQKYVMQK